MRPPAFFCTFAQHTRRLVLPLCTPSSLSQPGHQFRSLLATWERFIAGLRLTFWEVADQAHALSTGVLLKPSSLAEQQELGKPNLLDLARHVLPHLRQGRRNAPHQLCRPL